MTKTIQGAIDRAEDCVKRNISNEPVDIRAICEWAVGAAFRYMRGEPEPTGERQEIIPPPKCTCHPDDNPPSPCPRKHALRECIKAAGRDGGGNIHESGPTALGGPKEVLRAQSKAGGFTGDACPCCANFTMVQNGTCKKCMTCGETNGCS